VTLFIAELDPATGDIEYINAGHNPPLVARDFNTVEELGSGGFPLGIMPLGEYELGKMKLASGEALVIYSDGVSEANNPTGEEYGMDRLGDVIKKNLQRSASGLRDKVESSLSDFSQNTPAGDDITLVIVKRIE
jgi:phosphoserine phosphatase RsbU/P